MANTTQTNDSLDEEARKRAEFLHKHNAPKGWLIFTEKEINILKAMIANNSDEENERLREKLRGFEPGCN